MVRNYIGNMISNTIKDLADILNDIPDNEADRYEKIL